MASAEEAATNLDDGAVAGVEKRCVAGVENNVAELDVPVGAGDVVTLPP